MALSHIRLEFLLFLPILSHIHVPLPALGTDKKRTAPRWPHVVPWRHCNFRMTSPCPISACLVNFGSLLHAFQISNEVSNGEQENESIMSVRGGYQNRPSRSSFVINLQAL